VIFSAVLAICIVMIVVLPQAASTPPAIAAPETSPILEQVEAQPTAVLNVVVEEAPVVDPPPAEAAAAQPVEALQEPPALEDPQPQAVDPPAAELSPAAGAVRTAVEASGSQQIQDFAASLINHQAGVVVGVYVEGLFAHPVVEQPPHDENFVSSENNVLTRYARPGQFGVTALLAHNYLNGRLFFQIQPGHELVLVYGDGQIERYQVTDIQNYQALSPHDVRSDFRDLNGPGGEVISYSQLFERVYTRSDTVVLQTCIEANGDPSWGRIFIIANPSI